MTSKPTRSLVFSDDARRTPLTPRSVATEVSILPFLCILRIDVLSPRTLARSPVARTSTWNTSDGCKTGSVVRREVRQDRRADGEAPLAGLPRPRKPPRGIAGDSSAPPRTRPTVQRSSSVPRARHACGRKPSFAVERTRHGTTSSRLSAARRVWDVLGPSRAC
jgi:hypothetical protein